MYARTIQRIPRMNKALRHSLAALGLALVLALLFTGCGSGLPDDIRQDAAQLEKRLKETGKQIRAQMEKYDKISGQKGFTPMADYADRENWKADFSKAEEILSRAQSLYASELAPLLDENKPETAPRVKTQIQRIQSAVKEATDEAGKPFNRMERIRLAMEDTRDIYAAATKDGDRIIAEVNRLEQGPVADALEKFPDAAQDITNRFSPLSKMADDARAAMTSLEYQFQAHKDSGTVDYAVFIDAADLLASDSSAMEEKGPKFKSDIDRLYQSYTKVLQDMKVDYYLTIKRESWDEASDYYDPKTTTFTRKVSPDTYEALADNPVDSIAEIMPAFGFGRLSFKNNIGSAWDALEINPTENWPDRRHTAASFWIEDTKEDYFHKYVQEANGETTETGWVKVNPSFYEQNVNNLGMAILSKPYGEFEPDTMAAPPGMAYVGNPQYGEWKKDDSGTSFWSWYGRYAFFSNLFFFPPSYYYYGSWNRWRTGYRHQKPYYGRTDSGKYTYGTRGTQVKNSPRYQNTTFARTGGFKTAPASVRGGGASLRGGGPNGKGK